MKVMGILNTTPDSFSDGGSYMNEEVALLKIKQLVADGADIIDIGGESTRPGSTPVSLEEELKRTVGLIKKISKEIAIPISIDTYKAEVALQAVAAGATIINDIGGAKFDPSMPEVMAKSGVTVVLMHNRQSGNNHYNDIVLDVKKELQESLELVLKAGVKQENIVLDPGFGFAKTAQQNVELMQRIDELQALGYPLLVGISKKRTIGHLLGGLDVNNRGIGTVATTCYFASKGIDYVRVHDVLENKQATSIMKQLL